jgi:spermidine synthase
MNLRLALLLSLVAGFVSISMEMIWFSILGYMFKGHAYTFSVVLFLVLLGIALGAKYGYRAIKKPDTNPLKLMANYLLIAGITNFLGFPVIAWLMTISSVFAVLLAVNVVAVSALLGCIFPLLCHISVSSSEQKVGRQTSQLYAANIIGATTGPLITGYILFDYFSPEQLIAGLCVVLMIVSLILRLKNFPIKSNTRHIAVSASLVLVFILLQPALYTHFLEHIHYQSAYGPDKNFKHEFHNRSGSITVDKEDRFFGSGAYDGAINTDPWVFNINSVDRAYMVASIHRAPEKVLMIGLSTGSWAKVLADYDQIKELTIVEINPGYIELIKRYPEIATILTDKKVKIIIDDGRRWLKKNPDKKYDLIVMNTTYYWRQNSTNLYSIEFLTMTKKHLKEKGVLYWNTTKSKDAHFTAAHVFSHLITYGTFAAVSDSPFDMTLEEKGANLKKMHRKGEALFTTEHYHNRYNELLAEPLKDIRDSLMQQKDLWLITDDNMAGEYKADVWRVLSGEKKIK